MKKTPTTSTRPVRLTVKTGVRAGARQIMLNHNKSAARAHS
jgi:hypothetical protein